MKILTIIGARPQFVKAAPVSRELRKQHIEVIVHTGQHYDKNMSDVFFEELNIPTPNYNLNVGSGSHGKQTGEMLAKIEEVILIEKPQALLVYGDTNSTLAGALAASKLHIPVIHIEAGLRSYNMRMPEEQNRVLTDHISSILFCPTENAVSNLAKEGVINNVYNVGDVMLDALLYNVSIAENTSSILVDLNLRPKEYILATVHRAENTDDLDNLENIFLGFKSVDYPVIVPLHPRTKGIIQKNKSQFDFVDNSNIQIIDPIPYLDMIKLQKNAVAIMTDSGGVQKEAYFLKVPCITLRNETEWVETLEGGWNTLVGSNTPKIIEAMGNSINIRTDNTSYKSFYGSGDASAKIAKIITEKLI